MRDNVTELLLWLRTSGLRILLIVAGGLLLARFLRVLAELCRTFAEDPAFGKLVLEPPQVTGVEAFAESQVTVRLLAKTLPLKQWEVARELRRRIKGCFDREGIQIPYPHRIVIARPDNPRVQ